MRWEYLDSPSQNARQGGVLTIGNFDGLHLGHQALLKKAQEYPGPRTVLTFDPHPLQVLRPDRELRRLLPREDLSEMLPNYGVDQCAVIHFTPEFARVSAVDFLNLWVAQPFRPNVLVVGYDFAYGHRREGDWNSLKAWAEPLGVQLFQVPPVYAKGELVSSRRIRECVRSGDMATATLLLGREFYLRGRVIAGSGRGEKLGFATLNLDVVNETEPARGVYVTWTGVGGQWHPSVCNVGVNPTFGDEAKVKIETHVLSGKIAVGENTVDLRFVKRLRDEIKFASPQDLKKQIEDDILKAKQILGIMS